MSVLDQLLAQAATSEQSFVGSRPQIDLLTVSEAAELLRVSVGTIRNWIGAGSIPYVQLPPVGQRKQYRIPFQGLLGSLEGNYDLRGALQEQNARMRDAKLSED
jgi:excisionase family DNA binding protein